MKNYFNHKSVADLIDSVVNRRDSEEKVSLEKVLSFDGVDDPFQQIYIDKVKSGEYKFFKTGDSNWDYYIDENSYIYSIAKVDGAKSTHYGSLNYYKRREKERKENLKYAEVFR